MKTPIIVDENGDISFFSSSNAAEMYMEPIDVKNDEYVAYDSEGYLLDLSVVIRTKKFLSVPLMRGEWVCVSDTSPKKRRNKELYLKLVKFMVKVGVDEKTLRKMSLKKLVHLALKKYGK